jgi:hypothetical protein
MSSERCKLPLKVALALTLAIVCALWLGWEKPYWAGLSVIVMSVTETTGHSLRKGRHRLLGTLMGVITAFMFVGFFSQQPLLFLLCFTVFTGLCVYMQTNARTGYIWSISLVVCTLILVMGKISAELTFTVAVLRLQETLLGIICFSLVFSLLWPASSRRLLMVTLQSFFAEQVSNTDKTADVLAAGHSDESQGLGFGDGLKFLTRLEDLLPAAMSDSYHIASEANTWNHFLALSRDWALLCGHLSEACELLGPTGLLACQEPIQALLARVKQRFANAEALLHDVTAYDNPLPNEISLYGTAADEFPQHGAILLLEPVLNSLDSLSSDMLLTLRAALAQDRLMVTAPVKKSVKSWSLEPERLCQALKVCIITWICIGLWLYVPMTGGPLIALFGVIFGSTVISMPFCNVKTLTYYILGWSSLILLQYVLIMPHFTELWQLASFYFLNCFGIWYWFPQPQQVLSRMLGSMLLVVMTMGALKMNPEYNIQLALLQLLLISVAMLVIFFVNHGLFSSQPERVFLRHMSLLRHQIAWQLKSISQTNNMSRKHIKPNSITLKARNLLGRYLFGHYLFGHSPLRSVLIAEQALAKIDWVCYQTLDKAQLERIIPRLYAVNLRLLSLQDCYVSWLQQDPAAGMVNWPAETMMGLASLIMDPGNTCQLQQQILMINEDPILQTDGSWQQAVPLYQVQAALKLLSTELKQLSTLVSQANLHELKHSYFAL